ncbi:family 78 glycoside hydrolase catalytic domain [Cellulomonas hominis]|uniref:family 78 glycoside hydrolase catalytic domain n=1 Tax=Cellulomonas hominis TaxID=156981 RepID=UPI001443B7C4|nr:family 78 glycoside hydrolase catalytic domain [Cellulomonas hominis]NKY10420.1 family 78 glycoside hydrolase catalytic domain [Cellulomonas hominis]
MPEHHDAMTHAPDRFAGARWIARAVPRSTRIQRQITRTRIDWAPPGHALGQAFRAEGPVVAVNVDLHPPRDAADPHGVDVRFTVALETADGAVVASRVFEGPQLVWDYFGPLLDVTPPSPPGDYVVVVRAEREEVGWSTADRRVAPEDDGVSPLDVAGAALADGRPAEGVRMIGVETLPAPNPVFRRAFDLAGPAESASLSAVVLGTGVLRVNGVRVGEEVLEPAVTDYDKTVLHRTWDVAHLLRPGHNEIVVEAGRERYAARGGDVWGWNLAPWHREPVALARLDVRLADGATATVVTDADWRTAAGTVQAERLFRGEDHVVRDAPPHWEPVTLVAPPAGRLRESTVPPVLALAPVPAVTVRHLGDGRTVHDLGRVMVGRIRCRVTGGPGGAVRVVSGEQLAPDGSVVCDNFLVAGEAQVDTLRLDAAVADHVWEPQFGYRGFRWMQVETTGGAVVEEVRAVPLYTPLETVGELACDEPLIEWIDAATARTFRNNFHGIPTDTPIYEKNGWTADAHLATEGLLHHLDLRAAFGKWLDDHVDAQAPDGSVPQIIPTPGWGRASDPTWSSSAVLIPWYLFREYGDRTVLEQSAALVRRFADHLLGALDGGPWTRRTWGDWLSPGHMVGPEGMAPIGTVMAVTTLQHAAGVLRELGDDADADRYEAAAAHTGAVYHERWFDPASGTYAVPGVGYRQALNILPLAFGVVPEAHVGSVRAGLVADLEHRTAGHLDCGAVGVRHLLPVLSAAGRDDLAITVLTRRDLPGWGAWFTAGESTLLESWDPDARSRNHYFLGSVSAWIQQRVGGLRLLEPGWRSFEVAPVEDPRVTRARIRHRTPLGDARVAWERGPGGWRFAVTVPEGATARVRVAAGERLLEPGDHVLHLGPRAAS